MQRRTKAVIAGTAVAALVGIGATAAVAGGADDDATDTPIAEPALARATAAALAHTGGGRVTGTEVGDEESRYEVEVTLEDGTQLDVQLDEGFQVVGEKADDDSSEG